MHSNSSRPTGTIPPIWIPRINYPTPPTRVSHAYLQTAHCDNILYIINSYLYLSDDLMASYLLRHNLAFFKLIASIFDASKHSIYIYIITDLVEFLSVSQ